MHLVTNILVDHYFVLFRKSLRRKSETNGQMNLSIKVELKWQSQSISVSNKSTRGGKTKVRSVLSCKKVSLYFKGKNILRGKKKKKAKNLNE